MKNLIWKLDTNVNIRVNYCYNTGADTKIGVYFQKWMWW